MTLQIEAVQISVPTNDSILPMTFQTRSVHSTWLHQHWGLGMPKPNHRMFPSDTQDGSSYGGVNMLSRMVSLRIGLEADNRAELESLRDNVFRLFSPSHELLLRISRQDGTVRSLYGYYQEGLEYDSGTRYGSMEPFVVVIECPDPISVGDMREADISGSVSTGSTWTIPMTIPFVIGPGEWNARHPTHYAGTYKSYPCIDIHGPADTFTLRNVTTGGSLILAKSVGTGIIISVDLQTQNVKDADGANQYGVLNYILSGLSDMYLQHGENIITVEGSGFNANSRAVVSWKERWLEIV